MREIPDASIDLILCDLPYQTTACHWDSLIPFVPLWEQYKRIAKPKTVFAFTSSQPFTTSLINSNISDFKYCWVWEKNRATNFPNAKRRPLTAHEDIVIFNRGPMWYNAQKTTGHAPTRSAKGASQGTIYHGDNIRDYKGGETTRFPRTVLRFNCERGLHPTQKPVALFEYLIKTYSNPGDLVLDNCAGSGTTGLAARNTGRNFILIEREQEYVDVIKKRLELV